MSPASIDVIVPVFDAARTVAEAIGSLQRSAVPGLRIVVVDDGSTDGTGRIVAALAAADPRIEPIAQENRGIVAAMNRGLAACRAEFVARLDADDLAAPDRLERQAAFLCENPDVVAVSGAHREIDAAGRPTGRVHRPPDPSGIDPWSLPAREPQLTQPFMMARRAAVERVGGYRPFFVAEDSDLYWRLLGQGRLATIDAILGCYRMHAGSISGASVANGRCMAAFSQLAALSAQRRMAGRPDVRLPVLAGRPEGGMEAILGRLSGGLDARERRWLRTAAAAKLMELSGYRPYELETADCRFVAAALADPPPMPAANARELAKMLAATAARMVRLGRLRDAALLAPLRLWPETAARAGANRLYWRKHLP